MTGRFASAELVTNAGGAIGSPMPENPLESVTVSEAIGYYERECSRIMGEILTDEEEAGISRITISGVREDLSVAAGRIEVISVNARYGNTASTCSSLRRCHQ